MKQLMAATRLIEAMSRTRSYAEGKITNLGDPFYEHVLKVFLFPNSSQVNHWCGELKAWFYAMQVLGLNLKGGKKFKADEFEKFLTETLRHKPNEVFPFTLERLVLHHPRIPHRADRLETLGPVVLHNRVTSFYQELAVLLATDSDWGVAQSILLQMARE